MLKQRDYYLEKLISLKDNDKIKFVTGLRRVGKTSLFMLMKAYLLNEGVSEEQIISLDFDSLHYKSFSYEDLYAYVHDKLAPANGKKVYMFFDEVQRIKEWQKAINACFVDVDCDIYIASSNGSLLSHELSRHIAAQTVRLHMYPMSFREFFDFHGYKILGDAKGVCVAQNSAGDIVSMEEMLGLYAQFGGMPGLSGSPLEESRALATLDGIYASVVLHDILEQEEQRSQRNLTDAVLLRKVTQFLAYTLGDSTSNTSISKMLGVERMFSDDARQTRPATQTVQAYIKALKECYLFDELKRFDIRAKEPLKTLTKFYIADTGLRTYLMGFSSDMAKLLENMTYYELRRRGFSLVVGKLGRRDVHFLATREGEMKYIQVVGNMADKPSVRRAMALMNSIHDNYEKIIITLETGPDREINGIKILEAVNFLLGKEI